MKTELLKNENGYNFWHIKSSGGADLWNITPEDHDAPNGGYYMKSAIEDMKGQSFCPRHPRSVN